MSEVMQMKANNNQHGFTLLELVLVLFILAILTTTGLSFLENEDGQLRYNQSLTKRDAIVDAIYQENLEGNQRILSGFVVDNGRLPDFGGTDTADERIQHLLDNEDSWLNFDERTIQIHTETVTGEVASGDGLSLFKGFSNSNYLRVDNDTGTDEYRDGWGQQFFLSDPSTNQITIGYDGDGTLTGHNPDASSTSQLVKPSPFNTDADINITQEDWTIDIDQLHIDFSKTDTSCPTADPDPCDYTIAVVVFRNAATCGTTIGDCWDTYHFETAEYTSSAGSHDTTIDATTWNQNGSGSVSNDRIPAGEHIAIVLANSGLGGTANDVLASAKFKVLPNSTQPTVTLTVP